MRIAIVFATICFLFGLSLGARHTTREVEKVRAQYTELVFICIAERDAAIEALVE